MREGLLPSAADKLAAAKESARQIRNRTTRITPVALSNLSEDCARTNAESAILNHRVAAAGWTDVDVVKGSTAYFLADGFTAIAKASV